MDKYLKHQDQNLDRDQCQLFVWLTMSAVGSSCSHFLLGRKVVKSSVSGGSRFQVSPELPRDQMSPDQVVSGRWIRQNSTFSNSVFSSWLFFLHSSFSTLCRCGQVRPRLLLLHVELWVMKTTDVKQGLRCPLVVNFVSSRMNTDQFYWLETEVKLKRRCVTLLDQFQ